MSRNLNIGAKAKQAMSVDDARARAELARATRLTTIGQAVASIAHEIKQPLAAIVTNGNAALRWLSHQTPNVAEAKLALERVVGEGHRAGETIQNIRAMLERNPADAGPADLNEAIGGVIALLDDDLAARGVRAEIDLASGLSPVAIDRARLQQVVLNLVMNALEAMEPVKETARVLRVTSRRSDDDVMLTVEDRGTGIAAENVDRVFIPFFTTKSHALGLGLTICRSIVEGCGGRVYFDASMPHGTAFHVVLAATEPAAGGGTDQ